MRLLRKRGVLPDEEDPPIADELDSSPLTQLAAAAVQGKLALGPQAGAPTPRIGHRRQAITPRTKENPCAGCDGSSLHANVCIPQGAIDRLEQLARYAARPPIVEDRLSLSADGSHMIYRFRRPFRDGSTHVVLSCQEFIARLAALIPRPRAQLVTYHSGGPAVSENSNAGRLLRLHRRVESGNSLTMSARQPRGCPGIGRDA